MHEALRNLPQTIRQLVNDLTDADVAGNSRVIAALEKLAGANSTNATLVAARQAVQNQVDDVDSGIAADSAQIAEIDGARTGLALEIAADARSDDDDRAVQFLRADVARRLESRKLALASLRGQLSRINSPNNASVDAEVQLETARTEAKITLVQQRQRGA